MRYEFHPEAEAEFIEAAAYYERSVPDLSERFGAEVRGTLELLLQYPELGLQIDPNLRKVTLRRFPYYVIYGVSDDLLTLVTVAHAHRDLVIGDLELCSELHRSSASGQRYCVGPVL